jgi:hypothetical protein
MFRITITEFTKSDQDDAPVPNALERYTQSVDAIDLPKIIAAVNAKPRKARVLTNAKKEAAK